jgi:hypothetical protein
LRPPHRLSGLSFDDRSHSFHASAALALAGCATLAAARVERRNRRQLPREGGRRSSFRPARRLNYTPAENELAERKGLSPGAAELDALVASPEGQAYIKQRATVKMQAAFQTGVTPLLRGANPARVEVAVVNIDVPGLARTVLLGGPAFLKARVSLINLVDRRDFGDDARQDGRRVAGGRPDRRAGARRRWNPRAWRASPMIDWPKPWRAITRIGS